MTAKLLRVSLGVGHGRLHTAIAARNAACFLVSVAHAVVLENAGTRGLYTKHRFSSRLYSLVLQVRARESRERGAQHVLKFMRLVLKTILRTTGVVTLIEEDKVCRIFRQYYRKSVVLPTKTLKALEQYCRFELNKIT